MPSGWSELALKCGGLCSMSDTMESFKDLGGSPCAQPSVRIKHLTRNTDSTSRFPKLDECAHFHYDNVELGPINVALLEDRLKADPTSDWWFSVQVTSNGKSWQVRRSSDNFQMLDKQLHRCVYDRKFSLLKEVAVAEQTEDVLRIMLTEYLERFSQLAGSLINCGPVLNWLELDNRGNRLIVTDEAAINTPAIAAAYVIKRYASQATDEISLEVGDIISVIDMPPPDESTWWRGKKGFQVGFFPCECVEIIGDKVPQSIKIPKVSAKPVLRKHGKLIAFFRSFLLSRPSRRKLKQSGILKERVFGCDLGEHLMNTGRDIPLVLKCCTEFIEQHGIVDGIYRLSGVTSNIQKLRLAFDEDKVPNLLDEAILQDIHCVASLLKMYFRELPNPLLTFHLYDKFVNAVQAEENIRLLKLRDVVQQLPPPHYRSLEYLMRHLSKVAAHGCQTGMTPKNVAIVWAPNLLRSRDIENGGVGALHVVGVQAVLTEYLIRYTDIIFSEKMPIFPTPLPGEETPKKTRPKSLAISTPTKLLSLEEARSRALTSNLPGDQQKFIDVGGGEENLPIKYHTVIELPARRRSLGKSKKSPSGWRSFFSKGWHTTSGRRKNRHRGEGRATVPKIGSPMLFHHSPLALQDKAITESEISHMNTKKLRTVKSAESLFPPSVGLSYHTIDVKSSFSPVDENAVSSHQTADECTPLQDAFLSSISPSKSPSYQKHMRSTSHDSYFERVVEIPTDDESEMDDPTSEGNQMKTSVKSDETDVDSDKIDLCQSFNGKSDSPSRRNKVAQKQKLVSFDTEASSPKLQKLSLKRMYQAMNSPPTVKKKDNHICPTIENPENETSETQNITKKTVNDYTLEEPCNNLLQQSAQAVVLENSPKSSLLDSTEASSTCEHITIISVPLRERSISETSADRKDTVCVEVHTIHENLNTLPGYDMQKSDEDGHPTSMCEESDNLMSFSMEATISDSVSLSQLMSFDSRDGDVLTPSCDYEGREKSHEFSLIAQDGSLTTPESPTTENVSEMPSSAGSEVSGGLGETDKPAVMAELFDGNDVPRNNIGSMLKSSHTDDALIEKADCVETESSKIQFHEGTDSNSDEQLADQTRLLKITSTPTIKQSHDSVAVIEVLGSPIQPSNGSENLGSVHVGNSFDENLILSPPGCFVDAHKGLKQELQSDSPKTPEKKVHKPFVVRSLERSMTEGHDICPKFVSGIAVSGSLGHELFRVNSEFVDSLALNNKKRSCSERLSPMSPVEESRRRFESEIGRLIVRDRQMKLEMEQMKAERQKHKQKVESSSIVEGNKLKSERKFVDAVDFRKSPVKSIECDRRKPDSDDFLKSLKENTERLPEFSSNHGYSRYVRMENKPSVKELLSKFEGQKGQDDSYEFTPKVIADSAILLPKQTSNVFYNVQVVNHSGPVTSSKSFSLDLADPNQSSKTNQSANTREHIFQTECVVRFPHPKSTSSQDSTSTVFKNGDSKCKCVDSYITPTQGDKKASGHHIKVSNSRTAFLSSDNLISPAVHQDAPCASKSPVFQHHFQNSTEHGRTGRQPHRHKYPHEFITNVKKSDIMPEKQHQSLSEDGESAFSTFKDSFQRANKLTLQRRNEFLQHFDSPDQSKIADTHGSQYSNSSTIPMYNDQSDTRKRHANIRQRPKSVPPPICRLSFMPTKQPPAMQVSLPGPTSSGTCQDVPKTNDSCLSNGKELTETSQRSSPPKRIRDRAAIFERSLSFSSYMDKKTVPSCSQKCKAQTGSSLEQK